MCGYYSALASAYSNPYRLTNYAVYLTHPLLRLKTDMLLGDEAHKIEQIVRGHTAVYLSGGMCRAVGLDFPKYATTLYDLMAWARKIQSRTKRLTAAEHRPLKEAVQTLATLSPRTPESDWLVEASSGYVRVRPIWARSLTRSELFGQTKKVVLMSATLMGPDWLARSLGLYPGSWAYLDMASPLPPQSRPVYFSPIVGMNAEATHSASSPARDRMQVAIDGLIGHYLTQGKYAGLIHTVSHLYTDRVLTESRWRDIMTREPTEHARRILSGRPSVLVAPNLVEGWDGMDDLCRFIIIPKVPFPDLGDKIVNIRKQQEPGSFDYAALVSVVQAAGRGVRHSLDYCDTWILDANWHRLFQKRRLWLPRSFLDAYRGQTQLITNNI